MKQWMFFGVALVATLPAFAQNAPPAQQQAGPDQLFAAWDTDKNGSLSPDEFRAGYTDTRMALTAQRIRAEFARHDADHSGKLEAGEYAKLALVQQAGKGAPLMSAFDANKNGGLEITEYVEFVRNAVKAQSPATAAPKPK